MTKKAITSCVLLYERYMGFVLADAEEGRFDHSSDSKAYVAFTI
jgi:hypothetical protein